MHYVLATTSYETNIRRHWSLNEPALVPGTAATSRRRQSINPQVAVKSICDQPAADYDSWRRRR
jgi:hypothetical protein